MSRALIGWCEKHEYPACVYDDGSRQCMWELVVEAASVECRIVKIPVELLYKDELSMLSSMDIAKKIQRLQNELDHRGHRCGNCGGLLLPGESHQFGSLGMCFMESQK